MNRESQSFPSPTEIHLTTKTGVQFTAILKRHQNVCWRQIIFSGLEEIGDILYEPEDEQTMKLRDLKIDHSHRHQGIASTLLHHLFTEWKGLGYECVIGTIVAESVETKEILARWYESLGAHVRRESDDAPKYVGTLYLRL